MIDALSPLFAGPMVAYRDLITTYTQVQADDEASLQRVVPARDVLSPGWLAACIAAHGMQYEASPADAASHHSAPDEQALLSQWSKYLLSSMVSLPLAANLLLDHQLPLELRHLSLRLGEHGVVTQLILDDAAGQGTSLPAEIESADEATRLQARFQGYLAHLEAVIERLVPHTALGPKVFWSNAAHYFVYIVGMLEEQGWVAQAAPARQLMATRILADGRRNPLYQPVSDVMDRHGERHTPRKVCCVRYRIECLGYCSNCPLSIERATARRAQTRRVDQRANSRAALIGSDLS
ncbi:siderophore-iron reductase FhuF [Cobetia sp. Ld8]|uniref:siderophore-iron reductase FhuF n=1 Tax=Cobetia sp. Ld8 TaxID=649154 RepID=UPI00386608F3